MRSSFDIELQEKIYEGADITCQTITTISVCTYHFIFTPLILFNFAFCPWEFCYKLVSFFTNFSLRRRYRESLCSCAIHGGVSFALTFLSYNKCKCWSFEEGGNFWNMILNSEFVGNQYRNIVPKTLSKYPE